MAFSDPQKNIEQFGIGDARTVVDFGAGGGAYTIAAAREIRGVGRVYAVEVQKDLLSKIKNTALQEGVSNIETVWGDIEKIGGTKIADNFADAVIVSNVLFQVENKDMTVAEIKRILKPGGKVLVVDWIDSFGGMGPQAKDVLPMLSARSLFETAGFMFVRDILAGDHHYGFVVKKSME